MNPDRPPPWYAILALIGAACLARPAPAPLLFADDYRFLEQTRHASLLAILARSDPLGNYYRPLSRQLYFWVVGRLGGESPQVFHLVNLGLFVLLLLALVALVHRLAGARAAVTAGAILALHSAADVPLCWASGSQELLSSLAATLAILLHVTGWTWVAAAALGLALLGKEVVILTPIVAIVAARGREPWRDAIRRGLPLIAVAVAWAVGWRWMPHLDPGKLSEVDFGLTGVASTLAHLAQATIGIEWAPGRFADVWRVAPPLAALTLALVALACVRPWRLLPNAERSAHTNDVRSAVNAGLVWALAGALPLVAVSRNWSGYYALFAMCGMALALGAGLSRRPLAASLLVVAIVAWGSAAGRRLDVFATTFDRWTPVSHINRAFILHSTERAEACLGSLRRAHPTFPPRSTIFFAGLPENIQFQHSDGPLLRWAYRDSSLRSYYLGTFSLDKARRGPLFVFAYSGDTLREVQGGVDLLPGIAFGLTLGEQLPGAHDAMLLALERGAPAAWTSERLAFLEWALSDQADARARLVHAGLGDSGGPAPEIETSLSAFRAGDRAEALRLARLGVARHPLDPGAHALLADLLLSADPGDRAGADEAFAARALAPDVSTAWRRWGMVQARHDRNEAAMASFERYLALAGEGEKDDEVRQWMAGQARR